MPLIPDHLYGYKNGATDSEVLFLLALAFGLATDPKAALLRAVSEIMRLTAKAGVTAAIRISAAVSDGKRLYIVRYASDAKAPSLYYQRGALDEGWTIASEPLDADRSDWIPMPQNSFYCFDGDTVRSEEFYDLAAAA